MTVDTDLSLGLRSISQYREDHRQVLISSVIEQRIHCVITNVHSSTTQPRSGFNYHLTLVTVNLLQLSTAVVDSVSP